MNTPKISVIVPCYNVERWLEACLNSICAQSYTNLEIICVDDGSTDSTPDILRKFAEKDDRIRVITQPNAGLSCARNAALDAATGEWIAGVDSDDILYPGAYEAAVERMYDEVNAILLPTIRINETSEVIETPAYFKVPPVKAFKVTPQATLFINSCFWSKIWRRSVIEEAGIRFPAGLINEDEAFWHLSAPLLKGMSVVWQPCCGYRYRQGSIMQEASKTPDGAANRLGPIADYLIKEYAKRNWWQGDTRIFGLYAVDKLLYTFATAKGEESIDIRRKLADTIHQQQLDKATRRIVEFIGRVDAHGALGINPC